MEWTNYNHLFYFWTVARTGSISQASRELGLSQPTVSEQLRKLEESLGVQLFERAGRGLRLNTFGQTAYRYSEEMFRTGRELREALAEPAAAPERLTVGLAHSLPAEVVQRFLIPAMRKQSKLRLVCLQESQEILLARLAAHQVDVIFSDAPLPSASGVRAHSHLLARCGVAFFGAAALKEGGRFPQSLEGQPFLMPIAGSPLGEALPRWFDEQEIHPQVVGEFSDPALVESFALKGVGVFAVPALVEREVAARGKLVVLGRTRDIELKYFALTAARRPQNPHLAALLRFAME